MDEAHVHLSRCCLLLGVELVLDQKGLSEESRVACCPELGVDNLQCLKLPEITFFYKNHLPEGQPSPL